VQLFHEGGYRAARFLGLAGAGVIAERVAKFRDSRRKFVFSDLRAPGFDHGEAEGSVVRVEQLHVPRKLRPYGTARPRDGQKGRRPRPAREGLERTATATTPSATASARARCCGSSARPPHSDASHAALTQNGPPLTSGAVQLLRQPLRGLLYSSVPRAAATSATIDKRSVRGLVVDEGDKASDSCANSRRTEASQSFA
jgi:hypothetical protein